MASAVERRRTLRVGVISAVGGRRTLRVGVVSAAEYEGRVDREVMAVDDADADDNGGSGRRAAVRVEGTAIEGGVEVWRGSRMLTDEGMGEARVEERVMA